MLLRFSVENYQSFRDQVTLELVPVGGKEHPAHIIHSRNTKDSALNCVLIYGANASGKSGLFKAMTQAVNILKYSGQIQSHAKLPRNPFMLDRESRNKPTSFEFQFIADDSIKYVYGFSYLADRITEEYLLAYFSSRATKIFDYTNGEYQFTAKYAPTFKKLTGLNAPNKLFLATADTWNAEPVKAAYTWLTTSIHTFTDVENISFSALNAYHAEADQGKRDLIDFAVQLMQETDINITDFDLSFSDHPMSEQPEQDAQETNRKFRLTSYEAMAHHTVDGEDYIIPLLNESLGTKDIFFMAPILKEVFENKGVLVIDEIDRSLHPMLVRYLIDKFSAPGNIGAQLIATTHDIYQLDLKAFRRDQIYFTEKNPDNGVSELYSLCDYSPRKNEKIEKNYLLGRYGAIPYFDNNAEDDS